MTKSEYDKLDNFPIDLVSLVHYEAQHTKLRPGGEFIGVRKETLGTDDYSIIDSNGHPHYYTGCDLPTKKYMKEVIKKAIPIIKELLDFRQVSEKIDKPKERTSLTPKGQRKGCNCR